MKVQKKILSSTTAKKSSHAIATLKTIPAQIIQIKPGSVLDRMGGLLRYMLHGDGNVSSRRNRKETVEEHILTKAVSRKAL
jgi:hypothetical protein